MTAPRHTAPAQRPLAAPVAFLEEQYAPLLTAIRRTERISFARMGPFDYVLWVPRYKAVLAWKGEPLPDRLVDVDWWSVKTPRATRKVRRRDPASLLAADLLAAARSEGV